MVRLPAPRRRGRRGRVTRPLRRSPALWCVCAVLWVTAAPRLALAQSSPPDSAELTYVGNEGFLLSHAGRGVLIDALVRRGIPPYVTASAEQRERIERAEPPFDHVQLVLATHAHADHFDAAAVWRHLEYNEMAVFVSTNEAVVRVVATPSTPDIDERAIRSYPEAGVRDRFAVEGIDLDVLNLHHGRERQAPVQNVGFVVDIEGFRAFHMGDAETTVEELLVYGLPSDSLDVAFVPFWHLTSDHGQRMIDEAIRPRRVVAVHIPSADAAAPYFGSAGSLDALVARLEADFPDIIIVLEPMQTVRVPVGNGG